MIQLRDRYKVQLEAQVRSQELDYTMIKGMLWETYMKDKKKRKNTTCIKYNLSFFPPNQYDSFIVILSFWFLKCLYVYDYTKIKIQGWNLSMRIQT